MSKLFLFISVLFFLAGCGEESVNQIRPSRDDVSYSSSLDVPSLDNGLSSSAIIVESSSSSQYYISSSEESSSSLLLVSSSSEEMKSSSSSSFMTVVCGEMVDERDGQKYRTVSVRGLATWMSENLNYAYLQPTADLDSSSWCDGNMPEGCDSLGRFYLWSAMMDSAALFSDKTKGCGYYATEEEWQKCSNMENARGVCPEGWRLPTYKDYLELMSWRPGLKYGWCEDGETPFDEDQLDRPHRYVYGVYSTTYFWLAIEKNFAQGVYDQYSTRSLAYSEGASVIDLYIAEKNQFHYVRCVKDFEEVNE